MTNFEEDYGGPDTKEIHVPRAIGYSARYGPLYRRYDKPQLASGKAYSATHGELGPRVGRAYERKNKKQSNTEA